MSISKLSDRVRLLGASLKNLNPTAIYNKINEIIGVVNDIKPYKTYVALLTQTGTDAPVATVLENTLGGDVVWTRDEVGKYRGTLNGAFTLNKVVMTPFIPGYEGNADNGVFLPLGQGNSGIGPEFYYTMFIGGIGNQGEDYIKLDIYDNLIDNTVEFDQVFGIGSLPIEIRVYN